MSNSNKQALTSYLLAALILSLVFVGFAYCKHLSSGDNARWISLDRELRRIAYHAEQLQLRTGTDNEEGTSPDDSVAPVLSPAHKNAPLPPAVAAARQWTGELAHYVRDESPVLNL